MAASASPGGYHEESEVEQSFSIAGGDFTEAEKEYLRRRGLIYENSQEETLDISTDVGSLNSTSISNTSLMLFEENERIFTEILDKSANSGKKGSPMQMSPGTACYSKEVRLSMTTKTSFISPISSPGKCPYSPMGGSDSDKENEFRGPMSVQRRILFKDDLEEIPVRDPLNVIMSRTETSRLADMESERSQEDDVSSQISEDEDKLFVPCTQDVGNLPECVKNLSFAGDVGDDTDAEDEIVPCTQAPDEMEPMETSLLQVDANTDVDLVPCTQYPENSQINADTSDSQENAVAETPRQGLNVSVNLNETYTSVSLEESLRDEELVPCTQAPEDGTFFSENGFSRLDETGCGSVPCSQGSTVNNSSKSEFEDSIARMEYILKLADEQEEQERLEAEAAAAAAAALQKGNEAMPQQSEAVAASTDLVSASAKPSVNEPDEKQVFKTPLKYHRVNLLKNKKVASPSPPRSFADARLQQKGVPKKPALIEKKIPLVPKTNAASSQRTSEAASASSSPANTSTPKRAPLTNITPAAKKNHTPGRGGMLKTPVTAKVDSGLRASPFPVGLSPVARYIYEQPAPSKFARVQGVPNSKAATTSTSKIPLPPPRTSYVPLNKAKTPGSAAKQPRHNVLKTSTYFNLDTTPPQLVANEKVVAEKRRFPSLQYTGSQKVKALNGSVASPVMTDNYIAHRHTGLRDESGNASFVQNTMIQKRNIPTQSRLNTPKSDKHEEDIDWAEKPPCSPINT